MELLINKGSVAHVASGIDEWARGGLWVGERKREGGGVVKTLSCLKTYIVSIPVPQ